MSDSAEVKQNDYTKRHLRWIYDRLIHVHKENPSVDYMIVFDSIIKNIKAEK